VSFSPPVGYGNTQQQRLQIEVELSLDGAVGSLHNCTGACRTRQERALALANQAAAAPSLTQGYAHLQQLRLLYPRRAFASIRFADRAQEDGQNQGKWVKYERACRLLAVEVGDSYAMLAVNSANPTKTPPPHAAADIHRMQHALADLHLHNAKYSLDRDDRATALEHLYKACSIRGNVQDLDELAHFRMTQGTRTGYLMAESLYRTILFMQPSPTARYALAGALRASGNISGAIAEMSAGLEEDTRNIDMRVRLGQLWQHSGAAEGLARAGEQFSKVLELDSGHILASFLLAQTLYSRALTREAILQYEHVLSLHPLHCEARYNLVEAMHQAGQLTNSRYEHQRHAVSCIKAQLQGRGVTIHPLQAIRYVTTTPPAPPSPPPPPHGEHMEAIAAGEVAVGGNEGGGVEETQTQWVVGRGGGGAAGGDTGGRVVETDTKTLPDTTPRASVLTSALGKYFQKSLLDICHNRGFCAVTSLHTDFSEFVPRFNRQNLEVGGPFGWHTGRQSQHVAAAAAAPY